MLKINPEFKALIPPLSEHELAGLEEELRYHGGCYSPIITWNDVIVDGHNRYAICQRLNLRIKSEEMEFEDDDAARLFIYKNQLKRRNLEEAAKVKICLGIEEIENRRARKRQACGQGGILLRDKCPEANDEKGRVRDIIGKQAGVSGKTVERFKYIEKNADPKLVQDLCDGKKIKGKKLTIGGVFHELKAKEISSNLESIKTKETKAIQGVYDVITIDPPWPIETTRSTQSTAGYLPLQYPTMTLDEIKDLKIPCAENCHVFLWTTQKFLEEAFNVLDAWALDYVCTFTWIKNGGPQVVGLPQYNTEFFLYARKGMPKFADTRNFFTAFEAPKGKHSEKPQEFYDLLRRVTAGRRLDMFNRRAIEGFDGWGKEAESEEGTA